MSKISFDIETLRKMPNGSVTDAETIRQIAIYSIDNPNDKEIIDKIDPRFQYAGLYPHIHKVSLFPETVVFMKEQKEIIKKHILSELKIEGEVIAIFPYGSHVYGTDNEHSDHDYIIVMKNGTLPSGAFRDNAISNSDYTIQGVVYSRSGFKHAVESYEIGALECFFLPEDKVIFRDEKWMKLIKLDNWKEKAMVDAIIRKASDSRHYANMASKNGDKERGIKSMYHAFRILRFGIQLKKHQKIVNYSECNGMYDEFMALDPEKFDSRDYFKKFDELVKELRS
jgi:hypothetical protein